MRRLLLIGRSLASCVVPCFAAAPAAHAQDGGRALAVAVDVSAYHGTFRDDVASPLRYSGWGQQAMLTGRLTGRRWTFRGHLGAASATLRSSITSGALPVEKLIAATASLAALRDLQRDGPFRIGPEWTVGVESRDHHFSPPPEVLSFGLAYTGLAVRAERRWAIRGGRLVADLASPVISAVARPPTDQRVVARDGLRWNAAAPWTFRALDYRLSYVSPAGRRLAWSASHRLAYRRYANDKEYGSLENAFGLGLMLGRGSQ